MKKVIRIRLLAYFLIVAFSITSVFSCPGRAADLITSVIAVLTSNDSDSPLKPETGLFDEEMTEEERSEDLSDDKSDRIQTNLYFICTVIEPARHSISESQHHFFFNATRTCGNGGDVPRYLAQRSFII